MGGSLRGELLRLQQFSGLLARGTHATSVAVEEAIIHFSRLLFVSSDHAIADGMKLIVQTQLLPDRDQAAKLRAVVERFNEAANHAAGVAFAHRTANVFELRRLCYAEIRGRFGLSSQMAQLAIKTARDAYCRDRAIRPKFKRHAAVAYDQRIMSFKGIDRVSLLTLSGRIVVPFVLGAYQAEGMTLRKGQSDLVLRKDGKWFLLVTVDVPDGTPVPVTDFLGVDLGIANLATDSEGGRGI